MRGLDGLTPEELRASRRGWWDEAFTTMLLQAIPPDVGLIVDVGCGVATAAHALLPRLPRADYLGIDPDLARLGEAAALMQGAGHAGRVRLEAGTAEHLPCADGTVDLVLSSMTLQHLSDARPSLEEARRVLRPGGRFLAIEPDNLTNQFYFDGPAIELNAALHRLLSAQRDARRPADTAIGPRVPSLAASAGLTVVECRPHAVGVLSRISARDLLAHASQVATIAATAAGLLESDVFGDCMNAIDAATAATGGDSGYGGQVVLVFLTVATRT